MIVRLGDILDLTNPPPIQEDLLGGGDIRR